MLTVAAINLVGCTVTYPVVGKADDYKEVLVGEITADLMTGTSSIRASAQNTGFSCRGSSRVLHIPASNYLIPGYCKGQKGDADLRCTDGREIKADWEALSCKRGFGMGHDQNGVRFSFTFGMKQEEALAHIDKLTAETESKPVLPVYKPNEVRRERGYATGTGFFIDERGGVVTNFHVVESSVAVTVQWNGKEYPAKVEKLDSANDLAVLRIEAATPALHVSSARKVMKAQDVFTLGYPLISITGQEQKASFGRVNALSGIEGDVRFMQIDVPVQPGNSGGPLIAQDGSVVGVVTATLNQLMTLRASGSLPQNINYAVKSDYLLPLLDLAKAPEPDGKALAYTEAVRMAETSVVLIISR
jgi:S1-C subfamily serine protease